MPGLVDSHIHPHFLTIQAEAGNLQLSNKLDADGITVAMRELSKQKTRTLGMNRLHIATNEDAAFLVPLISESSGGVWPAVWKALANRNESIEESAIRYLTDPLNKLSVTNTFLAEINSSRAGAMILYQEDPGENVDRGNSPLPPSLFDALQPYRELSYPDSLFIAEICFLPAARGQGFGTQFLDYAKTLALEKGLPRVSLRVFSVNTGAVRLYEKNGFRVNDKRPVIAHPDIEIGESVLLMSCEV